MSGHIRIKLYANLKKYMPESPERYPITSGLKVSGLLELLGLPQKGNRFVFVNGSKAELKTILADGDDVGVFPPTGGG